MSRLSQSCETEQQTKQQKQSFLHRAVGNYVAKVIRNRVNKDIFKEKCFKYVSFPCLKGRKHSLDPC